MHKKSLTFFERISGAPDPVSSTIFRKVAFHELDPMEIVWHGRYPEYFEEAQLALAKKCRFSYPELKKAGILIPIYSLHVDYFAPLRFDDRFSVTATLVWSEGARINTEYVIRKADGSPATFAYSIQLFIDGITREPLWLAPDLWEQCRTRWKAGDFYDSK